MSSQLEWWPKPAGKLVTVREAWAGLGPQVVPALTPRYQAYWRDASPGKAVGPFQCCRKLQFDMPAGTVHKAEGNGGAYHPTECRGLSTPEFSRLGSFSDTFRWPPERKDAWHLIGNSVPPKFMEAIARQIRATFLRDDDFTYISLFAGCGGSSLGYKWAGGIGLAAVEFDANAAATYRLNFDTPVIERDIAKVTAEELLQVAGLGVGQLDVLDGSPPCQGFSTAGKRQWGDPRNSLFREYVRLVEGLQPRVFVMENVSGLVKGKMKLAFKVIMESLKATGYTVRCKLLDAAWFNVPQHRKRLIWIGVRPDVLEAAESRSRSE